MQIAKQKLSENIAEYILYMYQIEDIIRAYKFDIEEVMEHFVRPQLVDESFVKQYREWYESLISEMHRQKIEKVGHLLSTQEILVELSYLHNTLLTITKDQKYIALFEVAAKFIDEFRDKSDLKGKNEIETAFHALYMKMLLKLQRREISPESEEAFDAMRILLAYLSHSFHKMKAGDLDFLKN